MGIGGAFDKNKQIDKEAVFGRHWAQASTTGKWTLEGLLKLRAVVASMKKDMRESFLKNRSIGVFAVFTHFD